MSAIAALEHRDQEQENGSVATTWVTVAALLLVGSLFVVWVASNDTAMTWVRNLLLGYVLLVLLAFTVGPVITRLVNSTRQQRNSKGPS